MVYEPLTVSLLLAAGSVAVPTLLVGLRGVFRACGGTAVADDALRFAVLLKLRRQAFDHPQQLRDAVEAGRAPALLREMWRHADAELRQADPGEGHAPRDGFDATSGRLSDGRYVAVLTLPPPSRSFEPCSVAVVLPAHQDLRLRFEEARREIRFLVLKRLRSGRRAELCDVTWDGRQRAHRLGATHGTSGLIRAVDATLCGRAAA